MVQVELGTGRRGGRRCATSFFDVYQTLVVCQFVVQIRGAVCSANADAPQSDSRSMQVAIKRGVSNFWEMTMRYVWEVQDDLNAIYLRKRDY